MQEFSLKTIINVKMKQENICPWYLLCACHFTWIYYDMVRPVSAAGHWLHLNCIRMIFLPILFGFSVFISDTGYYYAY